MKRWRTESLEQLLEADAREALAAARAQADRDARRARRTAAATAAEAAAQLHALERLGQGLRVMVAQHRAAVRADAPRPLHTTPAGPTPQEPPQPRAEPDAPAGEPVIRDVRRRSGRASLRDSALTELFRVTEPRPATATGAGSGRPGRACR